MLQQAEVLVREVQRQIQFAFIHGIGIGIRDHVFRFDDFGSAPEQIVAAALQEDADAIGLSILSGAHMTQFSRVLELLKEQNATDIVVFGGGIIPDADIAELKSMGVAKIFTPGAPTQDIVDWVNSELAAKAESRTG